MNEYGTLAEFKAYIGVNDTINDGWWPTALEAASRGVDEFCGRVFYAAASVSSRDFVVTDPCVAHVDDFYLGTGLVLQTDTAVDGMFATTLAGTDYQLEPLNGFVYGIDGYPYTSIRAVGGTRFPRATYGRANLRVTAFWGWQTVPPVVKTATLELAKDIGKSKDFTAGAIGFGDVFARIKDNPALVSRLGPYRHPDMLALLR